MTRTWLEMEQREGELDNGSFSRRDLKFRLYSLEARTARVASRIASAGPGYAGGKGGEILMILRARAARLKARIAEEEEEDRTSP